MEPQETPAPDPKRQIPLTTFVIVVVLILALGGGAIAWILASDDDNDTAAPAPTTSPTTAAADDEDDEDDEADGDSVLPEDGLGDLGSQLECLGGLGGFLGGDRIELPDDDPRAQYEAIARAVEEERELMFESIPTPVFVTSDEMAERLGTIVERDYPADIARADAELLTAYGVVEPGTDMQEIQTDLLAGSVAGYYDPSNPGELVVLGDDTEPFDAIEATIIAHELEHALADQALGLPTDADPGTDDPDGLAAGHALAEGDATLTMTKFQLRALDLDDIMGMLDNADIAASQEALDAAPPFLARQLMFPYEDGLAFVCARQQDGGWEAVDEAYADPPTTTAQILFPDLYVDGVGAVDAPDPVAPDGVGWEEVRHMTFGAADLMFLLDEAGVDDARQVVNGWGGGEVTQWRRGDEAAVRISLVQRDGTDGLCAAVTDWTDTLDDATTTCADDTISVAL